MDKTIAIQKQIVDNAKTIQDFYSDLFEWEKEITKKDKILKDKEEILIKNNQQNSKKIRDKNSIKEYYDEWDKFNVDNDDENNKHKEGHVKDKDKDKANDYFSMKPTSGAKPNLEVKITTNKRNNNLIENDAAETIEKIKNEANTFFSINNIHKSIELYNVCLNQINSNKNLINSLLHLTILNNRGNAYMKLNSYNNAIKDFNAVLEINNENCKALSRRGLAYIEQKHYMKAITDLTKAEKIANENEIETIKNLLQISFKKLNENLKNEIKKMTITSNNVYSHNLNDFNKLKVEIIDSTEKDVELKQNISNDASETNSKKEVPFSSKKISITEEEIIEFIYDLKKENLTASDIKYAFRNLRDNKTEKYKYLLRINPIYIPQIFNSDIDKEILLEIMNCLKEILINEGQNKSYHKIVFDYLKNLTKIKRFKLAIKLLNKNDKIIIKEIFENLEMDESELFIIKDNFLS